MNTNPNPDLKEIFGMTNEELLNLFETIVMNSIATTHPKYNIVKEIILLRMKSITEEKEKAKRKYGLVPKEPELFPDDLDNDYA